MSKLLSLVVALLVLCYYSSLLPFLLTCSSLPFLLYFLFLQGRNIRLGLPVQKDVFHLTYVLDAVQVMGREMKSSFCPQNMFCNTAFLK